ncbi:E3 ubiquitin-protein ligase RNF31-like [Nematolebias whitei]|uniref:E3 ubiquitin-protein ligase RNF31-like n=1 Tax=Nematolebias whitei TaxID=451745 RepID=UPI00189AF0E7|nr:E3 ubiquitin-protein ligase RNF31-like [Nematolebias whitei]
MSLRMELEMLIKETHPHPEFYERIVPTLRHKDVGLNTDTMSCTAFSTSGPHSQAKSLALPLQHPSCTDSSHGRSLSTTNKSVKPTKKCATTSNKHPENCTICGIFCVSAYCPTCLQALCSECDRLYHSHPERASHRRTAVTSSSSSSSSSKSRSRHRKPIPLSEKMFYLKNYLAGEARKAVEGFFYQDSERAYTGAWKVLQDRIETRRCQRISCLDREPVK